LAAFVYFILPVCYSLKLKHIVIIDVLVIAVGFVIRAVAAGIVIKVPISSWLLICTITLALFLAFTKRRYELALFDNNASNHRHVFEKYSPYLLDQMIAVVTASTLIAYCFYTISYETIKRFGTRNIIFSATFVFMEFFATSTLFTKKAKVQVQKS